MHCRLLSLLLLLTLCLPAHALVLDASSGLRAPVGLGGHLAVRCADDAGESIEAVAAPGREDEFAAIPGLLIEGFSQQTCWLRFRFQRTADAPQAWFLEVGAPFLDDVTLHVLQPPREGAPQFASLRLGDRLPFADRPVPFRQFVFPVQLEDEHPVTAYLRIKTSSTMAVDTLNLWQNEGLLAHAQAEGAMYWFVFGLIALGLLSNLLFWFWLREPVYFVYSLYLLGLLLTNLSTSGYLAQMALTQAPILADRLLGVLLAATYGFGLLLFRNILDFRENFPRAERLVPAVLVFYAFCALASAAGYHHLFAFWLQLAGLAVILGILAGGPWLVWRGQRELLLYVVAFSIQFVMFIAVTLRNLGLWPLELPLNYFIMLSTGLHVVLLNIALAERVRETHRQKARLAEEAARLDAQREIVAQQREFVGMVAHEFGTPLAIIDTSAQRIAGSPQADAGSTLERCTNIREAVQRMSGLIEEFLTFDRMDESRQAFRPMHCRLDEIVGQVTHAFPQARFEVRAAQAPETVQADPALLNLALVNLIANALRYSPENKPVRLIVSTPETGGVMFAVEDEGPGIPPDEIPRIFQKYMRGRAAATKAGIGLGLHIVERVARMHSGRIEVENLPTGGARFTLVLPSCQHRLSAS